MAIILDGKKLRDKLLDNLKTKVEKLQTKPTLVVILVGDNPASKIYVNNKKKMAEKCASFTDLVLRKYVYNAHKPSCEHMAVKKP